MAQNPLPINPGALVVLAGKNAAGLTKYEVPLSITQVTAALLTTESATLTTTMNLFNVARVARTTAHGTVNTASAAAKDFLSAARAVFVQAFGSKFNAQWVQVGWTFDSTAVPDNLPDRLTLLLAVRAFLTADPTYEFTNKDITFTAAQAGLLNGNLSGALTVLGTAESAAGTAKDNRTAADTALRGDMRVLIGILTKKLTPNDPRWAEFGLNAPGAAVTPHAPEGLKSFPALAGQIHATCDAGSGVDYYRWFLELPGQTGFVFQADTAEPEVLLLGLTGGQTVKLRATAVNPAGESVPSAAINVAVG